MTGRRPAVLVLAPHATRTGSTRVLIELLGRVGERGDLTLRLDLLAGGPREDELRAQAPPPRRGEVPDAALANSALAAEGLAALPPTVPTAVYLHEPGEVLETLPPVGQAELRRAAVVLCVSEAVRDDAVRFGVAPERLRIVPPIVVAAPPAPVPAVVAARIEVGAADGDRIVVGCGEADWRKGPDLFVEVAAALAHRTDVRFAWVGRRLRPFARGLDLDVRSAGLAERLTWVGDVPDVAAHLAAADVLLLPSRRDPQPLVPFEAAAQATPTVGFAVGGITALGEAGAALTARFPDTPALAAHVVALLDDETLAATTVAAARGWATGRQGPDVVVPAFVAALHDLLGCSVS